MADKMKMMADTEKAGTRHASAFVISAVRFLIGRSHRCRRRRRRRAAHMTLPRTASRSPSDEAASATNQLIRV